MSDSYQLVVPMSGRSERFRRAGYEVPKYLLPIGSKRIIEHTLEMFPDCDDILLIVNEQDTAGR